ncbi:MAG: DUF3090 family protein [Candidatus Rokubacteria bacterium]|nr:DUF3090 family protein [Candidatus Rokubacteria bacterium]
MTPSFDLSAPDRFTAGAVGPPGQRVFYLQAREGTQVVTLKCEKEQVRALAEYLAGLLEKIPGTGTLTADPPLLEPLEPVWSVASIGVGYDEASERVIVVAHQFIEEEGDEPATARFAITRAQAAGLVERARALMEAGRPICPLCNLAIDPGGHICPRRNGHAAGHA